MNPRALLLPFALLTALLFACAKPINDGGACFQSSECRGGSICAETVYGNYCMKVCSADQVRCGSGASCLESAEVLYDLEASVAARARAARVAWAVRPAQAATAASAASAASAAPPRSSGSAYPDSSRTRTTSRETLDSSATSASTASSVASACAFPERPARERAGTARPASGFATRPPSTSVRAWRKWRRVHRSGGRPRFLRPNDHHARPVVRVP